MLNAAISRRAHARALIAAVLTASLITPGVSQPAVGAAPPPATASVPDTAPDQATASRYAREGRKSVEVTSATTETSQLRANPSGTWTYVQHSRPVRVQRGGGWVPVDLTLEQRPDGTVGPKAAPVDTTFSGGGKVPLVRQDAEAGLDWPADLPAPALKDATATYAEVLPGVDLQLTATVSGFSETFVVKTREAAKALTAVRFGAHAKGAEAVTSETPLMSDAGRQREARAGVEVVGAAVTLTPDRAFLDDPKTEYPVRLDAARTAPRTPHAIVRSQRHTDTNSDRLHTGSSGTVSRSFFQLDTTSLAGKQILSASVETEVVHSGSCDTTEPTQLWHTGALSAGTSWDAQPQWVTSLDSTTECASSGRTSFTVTGLVGQAAKAAWRDVTFGLRAENETDQAASRQFALDPVLRVEYNSAPAVPAEPSTENGGCATIYVPTRAPQLRAKVTDPDNGVVDAVYRVTAPSGQVTEAVARVASGAVAQVQAPGVTGDGRYRWQVHTSDGTATGPASQACEFVVDTVEPANATVSSTEYPASGSHGGIDKSGVFQLGPNGSDDVQHYRWSLNVDNVENSVNATGNGTASITLTPPRVGQNTLYVQAFDRAGNASAAKTQHTFTVADPNASAVATPQVSSTDYPADNQPHGGVGKTGTFHFRPGDAEPVAKYVYQLDNQAQPTEVDATPETSVTIAPTAPGRRTLTVRAKAADGTLSAPASYSFVVDAFSPGDPHELFHDAAGQLVGVVQPNGESAVYEYDNAGNTLSTKKFPSSTLTAFAVVPAQAPVGATVELSGTAFSSDPAANAVTFPGTATPAQVVSADRNRLSVIVPAGATNGPVSVKVGTATSATKGAFRVGAARPAPTISGFTPAIGTPGTTVTITGTGFDPDPARNAVRIHRTLARVTQASATSLTVTVPGSVSTGRISVRTPGGLAPSAADFVVPPSIVAPGDIVDGGPVALDGAAVTTTIAANKVLLLRFEGKAGDRIGLGLTANTISTRAQLRLYDPFGRSFGADQYDQSWPVTARTGYNLLLPELTTSGTYQIVLDPETTGTGAVTANLTRNVIGSTDVTAPGLAFNLTKPGQFAEISFEAERETWYDFGFTDATTSRSTSITIYEPNGAKFLRWTVFSFSNVGRFRAHNPGRYRVVIGVNDGSAGGAKLWASKEVDGGDITVDGPGRPVALTRPGQQARLRFDGTPNAQLGLGYADVDLKAGTSRYLPGAFVVQPDRKQLNTANYGNGADVPKLTQQGSHDLLILGGPATGTLTAWLSSDRDGGTMAVGGDKTISVPRVGQQTRVKFDAVAKQRISVGSVNGTYTGTVSTTLYDANGRNLGDSTQGGLDVQIPANGTYELQVNPNTDRVGDFTLQLSEAVNGGTIVADGESKTLTVSRAAQNAVVKFDGTAGQTPSIGLTQMSAGFNSHRLRVYRPDGTQLTSTIIFNADSLALAPLPTTGTYEISLEPDNAAVGSATLTLSSPVNAGAATIGGAALPVNITRAGQDGHLTFTGAQGDALQLNFSGTNMPTWFRVTVLKPDGTTLQGPTTRFDETPLKLTALPSAGTYKVVIDPRLAGTGSTNVAVARVTAAAATTVEAADRPRFTEQPCPPSRTSDARRDDGRHHGRMIAKVLEKNRFGQPAAGWEACGYPKAPESVEQPTPDSVWRPNADNLAGKGWKTGYGAAPQLKYGPDAPKGTTAVSGQILAVNGAPLANVTVSIGKATARSDANGLFLVQDTESGHRVLRVDGRSASTGDRKHGVFDIGVDVVAGQTLRLPHTVFLPQLDTGSVVKVESPTREKVVLRTQAIPGLEVHIPAGSVVRDVDGKVATELSITPIPVDRTPFPLPPTQVPIYFSVQPGSGYLFPAGAQIVYPNYTGEAPGTRTIFWNYDPEGQGWHIYGEGTVTPDGKQIVPDAGVQVYRFTGAMTAVRGMNPPPVAPKSGPRGGDPVDPATGLFVEETTDLVLNDVVPLEIKRTYQQGDPDIRPFGVGMNFNFGHFPWSTGNVGSFRYLEADLVQPDGSKIHFRRITPGETSFEDALFLADPTPTEFDGATMGWNGNGWDVKLRNGTTYVLGDEAPLQAIRDKFGNTTTISRAPVAPETDGKVRLRGPITQITSPNGKWVKFTYDTATPPKVTQIEDNLGRTVKYTYLPSGHLETVTSPENGVTRYTYENGRMKTVTDARNLTFLTNEFDTLGRVKKQTALDQGTFLFDYTTGTDGKIVETRMTNPRGFVTRFKFNSQGLATETTNALGTPNERTESTEYDPTGGRPKATIDPLGRRTEFEYDDRAQIKKRTVLAGTPDARTELFEYNGPFGELTAYTDQFNKTTRTTYDSRGAVLTSTDALDKVTKFTTNDAGQVVTTEDQLGKITRTDYEFGDAVLVTDPLGRKTRSLFDNAGRKIEQTDPRGNTSSVTYDVMGRTRSATDPLGRTVVHEFDKNGNRTKVTDPRLGVTEFRFNNMDLVDLVTDPLRRTEELTYDQNGNVKTRKDRGGKLTSFDYDELDRQKTVRFGVSGTTDQGSTSYGYDRADRRTSITDTAGGNLTVRYDGLDRVEEETSPQGKVSYTYSRDVNDRYVWIDGQQLIGQRFDARGLPQAISKGGADVVTYERDDAGKVRRIGAPGDGVHQVYDFDDAGQVKEIAYRKGAQELGKLSYSYDAAGNLVSVGGTYARVAVPADFGPATYDAANQLKTIGPVSVTYTADGQLASDGITTYSWNVRGQLAGTSGAGQSSTYSYLGDGRRASKTVNGTSTSFRYDGPDLLQEKVGTQVSTFVTGDTDQVFLRETGGEVTRYLTDQLGSTVALTGDDGSDKARYVYEPFGESAVSGDDKGNSRRFAGREDDGNGLQYNRARYYNPALQRFLSEDPIGFNGGFNLHAYVGNQPTSFVDPRGTKAMKAPAPERLADRPIPAADANKPWSKYQKHVTGQNAERVYNYKHERTQVDGSRDGYLIEAKWTNKSSKEFKDSPYSPHNRFYNEEKVLDQARRLLELNSGLGGKGVRYAVSNPAARDHFDQLFRTHFPKQYADGTLRVYHVPGNGM